MPNGSLMSRMHHLCEFKTKMTTLLVFLQLITWMFWMRIPLNGLPTGLFFLSLLAIDLAVTAGNTISDQTDEQLPFKRRTCWWILIALVTFSLITGLILVFLTTLWILPLGGLCFLIGLLYNFGPLPLKKTILGEVASGFPYGAAVPVLFFWIQSQAPQWFSLKTSSGLTLGQDFAQTLTLTLDVKILIPLIGLIWLDFWATAALMWTNNYCDRQADRAIGRFTLPTQLSEQAAKQGTRFFFLIPALGLPLTTYAKGVWSILLVACALSLMAIAVNLRGAQRLIKHPVKAESFGYGLAQFLIYVGGSTLFFAVLAGIDRCLN